MVTGLAGVRERYKHMSDKIAFLAYYDSGTLGFPCVYIDFTNELRIEPVRLEGGMTGDGRTSDQSLYDFARWCVHSCKHVAKNYALILSGHGDGFQARNFLRDDSSGTYLSLRKLTDALRKITTGQGYRNEPDVESITGKKISILGFDSCVMGSLEVANQIGDPDEGFVKTIVASQGFVPNLGWNYGKILDGIATRYQLTKNKPIKRIEMASIFAHAFIDNYRDYSLFSGQSVDLSICDLNKKDLSDGRNPAVTYFSQVRSNLYALATGLTSALSRPDLSRGIGQAILNSHWQCQTYLMEQCVDLKDFCQILMSELSTTSDEQIKRNAVVKNWKTQTSGCDAETRTRFDSFIWDRSDATLFSKIKRDCAALIESIDSCATSYNLGSELQYSTGLSVYFPWSLISFQLTKPLYTKLRFSDAYSPWTIFIEKYLKHTFRLPRHRSENPTYLFDGNGESMEAEDKAFFELSLFRGFRFDSASASDALNFGRSEGRLGQPEGRLGQPEGRLGQPEGRLGQPEGRLGQPEGRLGQPEGRLGQPEGRLGQPEGRLGQPEGRLLGPFASSNSNNFSKTKNFPWAPRLWNLSDFPSDEE